MNTKSTTMPRRRLLPLLALSGLSLACGSIKIPPNPQPTNRPDYLDDAGQIAIANYLTKLANRLGHTPDGFLYAESGPHLTPPSPVKVYYETMLTLNELIALLKAPDLTVRGDLTLADMADLATPSGEALFDYVTASVYLHRWTVDGKPFVSIGKTDHVALVARWTIRPSEIPGKREGFEVRYWPLSVSKHRYQFDGKPIKGNLVVLTARQDLLLP